MKEYFDCLIMTHGTAFGVGAGIFLLTILLVARRIIGFILSVILMLIALGASWAVNNEDFVRGHLDKWIPSTKSMTGEKSSAAESRSATPSNSSAQPNQSAPADSDNMLRGQVEAQKTRVQNFLDSDTPQTGNSQSGR